MTLSAHPVQAPGNGGRPASRICRVRHVFMIAAMRTNMAFKLSSPSTTGSGDRGVAATGLRLTALGEIMERPVTSASSAKFGVVCAALLAVALAAPQARAQTIVGIGGAFIGPAGVAVDGSGNV